MKLRSAISLDLVSRGYLRGSKEFKAAYARELRLKNPELRQRELASFRTYYAKKQAESNGAWGTERVKQWRLANPGKQKEIEKRFKATDAHRRFYAKHRERIRPEKREKTRAKRHAEPLFGIYADVRSGDPARIANALKKLEHVIDGLD